MLRYSIWLWDSCLSLKYWSKEHKQRMSYLEEIILSVIWDSCYSMYSVINCIRWTKVPSNYEQLIRDEYFWNKSILSLNYPYLGDSNLDLLIELDEFHKWRIDEVYWLELNYSNLKIVLKDFVENDCPDTLNLFFCSKDYENIIAPGEYWVDIVTSDIIKRGEIERKYSWLIV